MPENSKDRSSAERGAPDRASASRSWLARPLLWWLVAFAVIVLGYVDLARGGVSWAPVLLIVGYCIFVPIAILR